MRHRLSLCFRYILMHMALICAEREKSRSCREGASLEDRSRRRDSRNGSVKASHASSLVDGAASPTIASCPTSVTPLCRISRPVGHRLSRQSASLPCWPIHAHTRPSDDAALPQPVADTRDHQSDASLCSQKDQTLQALGGYHFPGPAPGPMKAQGITHFAWRMRPAPDASLCPVASPPQEACLPKLREVPETGPQIDGVPVVTRRANWP